MGRTVLVTGAARGIGRAIAERYRAAGWTVLAPPRAELDLASPEGVEAWCAAHPLAIDALVNDAGENKVQPIDATPVADFRRILDVNLTSAFVLAREASRGMAARGFGRVVNVSSLYGELARPGRAAYAASKAGLEAFTRTAALEWGRQGVLVNAVAPGFVETELTRKNNGPEQRAALADATALGRLAQPEEIAEVVFFLGSEANTYVTGETLRVDGGFAVQ